MEAIAREGRSIIDFASIILVYLCVRDMGEAGKKLLRNRDKRVTGYLYQCTASETCLCHDCGDHRELVAVD